VVLESQSDGGFLDRSDLAPHIDDWTHDHKFVATDLDLDGDSDFVVIVNNDPYFSAQNRVLRNRIDEGDGFVAETPGDLLDLVGDLYDLDAGDLDGDGDDDIVTTICAQPDGTPGEIVLDNEGGDLVRDPTALPDDHDECYVGTAMLDIDSDGDLDLFFGGTQNATRFLLRAYVNRGDGTFVDASDALPDLDRRLQVNHVSGGDLDRDGDQDLVIAGGAPYADTSRRGDVLVFILE
jgi:hypothetical protein